MAHMTTTTVPRPTTSRVDAANAARQRTAATKATINIVTRLHHLDDAGLCALARAVRDELREREMTAARETMAVDETGAGDGR